MTRIYFKPQGCCVRNPRSQMSKPAPDRVKNSEQQQQQQQVCKGWRKQLDPEAIDQIADGLEKMVLSWTSAPATRRPFSPCSTGSEQGTLLLAPPMALQDMMRGELIKTCRPSLTIGDSALAGQQSAEASLWYLTPAKPLPNHTSVTEGQDSDGRTLEAIKMEQTLDEKAAESNHIHTQTAWPHKWPRIQSIGHAESGSATQIKEAPCRQIDSNLPESVSYHIKAARSSLWNENAETNGGSQILDLIGKKGMLPSSLSPYTPFSETKEEPVDVHKKKIEELQIALLECAMEYEVKIVEMKMQMLQFKSEQRHKDSDGSVHSELGLQTSLLPTSSCHQQEKTDGQQRVEHLRKQLSRLQREKLALSRQLHELKKRERQFDLQRRSLDDALNRVNTLQRELAKRDQEIVNCQLREKEARAQLYEVQLALHKAQTAQIEPRKLLSLLPALREWLQTIKKVPCEPTSMEPIEKNKVFCAAPVDGIVCSVTKEIQALQKALSKLATKK